MRYLPVATSYVYAWGGVKKKPSCTSAGDDPRPSSTPRLWLTGSSRGAGESQSVGILNCQTPSWSLGFLTVCLMMVTNASWLVKGSIEPGELKTAFHPVPPPDPLGLTCPAPGLFPCWAVLVAGKALPGQTHIRLQCDPPPRDDHPWV